MNVFKVPKKKKCAFVYMDHMDEKTDKMIEELDETYDVYVYFYSEMNIYVGRYCSLNPVTGFIEGNKFNAEGLWELMKAVYNGPNQYYIYYFPILHSYYKDNDRLDEVLGGGLMDISAFQSENTTYDYKSKVYKKNKWDWIKFWDRTEYGVHSTRYSSNEIALIYNDVGRIIKDLDDDYIHSFKYSNMHTLIPSAFNYLNMKHINLPVNNIKPSNKACKP